MGQVVGDLLPLAVGVAISPIPIIAVILMLLAPRAGGTSGGFLAGWILGIGGATTVFLLLAGTLDLGSGDSQPSAAASWIKLALGVLLLLLAVRQWGARPQSGAQPALPKWMTAIDSFTAVKALGLGVLLSAGEPEEPADERRRRLHDRQREAVRRAGRLVGGSLHRDRGEHRRGARACVRDRPQADGRPAGVAAQLADRAQRSRHGHAARGHRSCAD